MVVKVWVYQITFALFIRLLPFVLKEKDFYVRRKGFLCLKEKDLFEKKSDQKKRKENYFYQPYFQALLDFPALISD